MPNEPSPTVDLVHGASMPCIGLGTWPMDDDQVERAVIAAAEVGYRLVDTAYRYGNEVGVGRGVRNCGLPRAEMFVTTKLNGEWHGYEQAQRAFDDSSRRLGLDYVDLYLIHWPMPWRDRYVEAWRGLAKLLEYGRVRAIGLSNFKPEHIERLLTETGVQPDVNQIQCSPRTARVLPRRYHDDHRIVTQSWSPLGQNDGLLDEPAIRGIADRLGRSPAQVVLRWHLQLGATAVPKSADPARMRANIDVFDFALSEADMATVGSLDRGEAVAVDSATTGH